MALDLRDSARRAAMLPAPLGACLSEATHRWVPVPLGCCPGPVRCLLCPPPDPPRPDAIAALIERFGDQDHDRPLGVRFFGGAPPTDDQLDAIAGLPFQARVRPDLLQRADADRLLRRGCTAIELDALTFHDDALRDAGRPYRGARVVQMSGALRGLGLRVGGVLAPGLPRTDHARCLADADRAVGLWSFVRLHPVLVLAGSALRERLEAGRYEALELAAAVTVCRELVDRLEAGGVEVLRVGLQPGPDGFGRAVAGPRHPSLRELVESRRAFDQIRAAVQRAHPPPGAHLTLRCAPADVSRAHGPLHIHVVTLRAECHLGSVRVAADPALARGTWLVTVEPRSENA